jgi:signal transduction histidine kinase
MWLSDLGGLLTPLDGSVSDFFVRLETRFACPPAAVLLVECPDTSGLAAEDWGLLVLDMLHRLGARQVVFTRPPPGPSAAFLRKASGRGNMLLGIALPGDAAAPGEMPLPWGVADLPLTANGVARQQRASYTREGKTYPALEVAAARQRLGDAFRPPAGSYYVRFRGGPGSLPHVPLEKLLSDQLVPELVQGKTVLIGPRREPQTPGLATPATPDGPTMSLLEFQGHALDTLLRGRATVDPGPALKLFILLPPTALGAVCYRRLSIPRAAGLCLVLAAALFGLAGVLFLFLDSRLPVAGLVGAQGLCLLLTLHAKADLPRREVKRLLAGLAASPRYRCSPPSFVDTPEHWQLLVDFLTQTLDLERTLFLEVPPGKRRAREVAACRCTLEDIAEKRRDCRRVPYAAAVAARGPIRVDQLTPPFLKKADRPEHQYLTPLVFAGQVLGFWALAVAPGPAAATAHFECLVRGFAEQIAELLHRRIYPREKEDNPGGEPRGAEDFRSLGKVLGLLESRLDRSERLFAHSSIPAIAFDLFGRVREVNGAMSEYLAGEGPGLADLSLVDLLARLTGNDLPFARRCVRQLLLEKKDFLLPARPSPRGRVYVLRVYPLEDSGGGAAHDPGPFRMGGIACELLDRTALVRLQNLKKQLTDHLGVRVRGDLAAVELAASLLTREGPGGDRREMRNAIHEKVKQLVDHLDRLKEFFALNEAGEADRLPLDSFACFEEASRELAPEFQSRGVNLEVMRPELMSPVLASPTHLPRLFRYLLSFLLEGTRPGTPLRVEIKETEPWLSYAFTGSGYGLPEERFQAFLHGDGPQLPPGWRELCQARDWLRAWGGHVEADSKPGDGIWIHIRLPRFR